MSEYTDGIQHAIDSIEKTLENEVLDVLPSRVALKILMAGLKQEVEES